MTRMTADTPPDAPVRIPDLAEHHRCQAELYKALAAYQHACAGEGFVTPGSFGLAVYLRRPEPDHLEAVLCHSSGGEISSGARICDGEEWLPEMGLSLIDLLLRPYGPKPCLIIPASSTPADAETLAPPAAPEPEHAPAAPVDLDAIDSEPITDEPPTAEEIEAVTLQLEAIHAKDAGAVKPIITAYKAQHDIGRSPFIKSITTRDRLTTIQRLIADHTT